MSVTQSSPGRRTANSLIDNEITVYTDELPTSVTGATSPTITTVVGEVQSSQPLFTKANGPSGTPPPVPGNGSSGSSNSGGVTLPPYETTTTLTVTPIPKSSLPHIRSLFPQDPKNYPSNTVTTTLTTTIAPDVFTNPVNHSWNLPPHIWSRPLAAKADPKFMPYTSKANARPISSDKYRRGRIWWKASPAVTFQQVSQNTTKVSSVTNGEKATEIQNFTGQLDASANYLYGFQFLWNPTDFSTTTNVTTDVTPTQQDQWVGAPGSVAPGQQTISFNVVLDRTNDFACAANYLKSRPTNITARTTSTQAVRADQGSYGNDFIDRTLLEKLIPYYRSTNGTGFISDTSTTSSSTVNSGTAAIVDKLWDLFQRGTMADLEFLYRSVMGNAPGANGGNWINPRGIYTADQGFLIPTLLNVDIGPLSYVGYITSVNVAHSAFTQDMIPIRSVVTINLAIMSAYGLTSTSAQATQQAAQNTTTPTTTTKK